MSFHTHPHDQLFAVGSSHAPIAKAFLRKHLKADLKAAVEIDGLEILSGAFVDAARRLRADAVFRLPLRGGGYLLAMVEQESQAKRITPARSTCYSARGVGWSMMHQGTDKDLAFPWPIVFYTGKPPYTQPTHLVDLFPASVRTIARCTLLGTPVPAFQLIELRLISDEVLMADEPDILGMLLKHVHDPEMAPTFQILHPYLRRLGEGIDGKDCQDFVEAAFLFGLHAGNTGLWKDVILPIAEDCMKPNRVEVLMTTAERLKFEGMQQGMQQGELSKAVEIARNMLSEGIPSTTIAKVTHLPKQQIQELCGRTNGST